MHVIVPTVDLVQTLSRLKPIKSVTTSGAMFSVYTIEATDNKLRIIAGDGYSFTATTEIFADIKSPGKISVNGTDFYTTMMKIIPAGRGPVGSDKIEMKVDKNKLKIKTTTHYATSNAAIKQSREFTLVKAKLSPKDDEVPPDYHLKIPGEHIAEIFKIMSKMISAYTSDIEGLSGVLMRVRAGKIVFVVSDGVRLLEICCPYIVKASDFDITIPKMTCSLVQSLIGQGDQVDIHASQSRIKFITEQGGLKTTLLSSLIPALFPDYSSIFEAKGPTVTLDSKILRDNIANVRRSLQDETYRLKVEFNGKTISLSNTHANSHLSFSNDNIPVESSKGGTFSLLINAFLLESMLSLIGYTSLNITVPSGNKPVVMLSENGDIKIRSALGVAVE